MLNVFWDLEVDVQTMFSFRLLLENPTTRHTTWKSHSNRFSQWQWQSSQRNSTERLWPCHLLLNVLHSCLLGCNRVLLTLIRACLHFIKGGQFFTHRGIRTTVPFLWLHPREPFGDQEHCVLLHHLCGRCVVTEKRASWNDTWTGCYIILLTHFEQFCFKELESSKHLWMFLWKGSVHLEVLSLFSELKSYIPFLTDYLLGNCTVPRITMHSYCNTIKKDYN